MNGVSFTIKKEFSDTPTKIAVNNDSSKSMPQY